MQYSVYINQPFCVQHGMSMAEACLLHFLCLAATWAATRSESGKTYYLCRRSKMAEEMPLLGTPRNINNKIRALEEKGMIERLPDDASWVALTPAGASYVAGKTFPTIGRNLPGGRKESSGDDRKESSDYQSTKHQSTNYQGTTSSPQSADTPPAADDQAQGAGKVANGPPPVPVKDILAAYHELLPMMPRVARMTDARTRKLRARWREDKRRQSVDYWRRFFGYVAKSDFLTGRNGVWRNCNFEWLIGEGNHIKVVEGNYENEVSA